MKNTDLSKLHPLTNLLGTLGPLLFGASGTIYLFTYFLLNSPLQPALYLSLFGLVLFILGAITISLQKERLQTTEEKST